METALNIVKRIFFLCSLFFAATVVRADDSSFSNVLARADIAEQHGDMQRAQQIYDDAQKAEATDANALCVLSRRYCNLTYLTTSTAVQKDLIARALACAKQAVADAPSNATAHASLAVCYAKSCNGADIKTELEDSRLFKGEAEKAIALDPKEDTAWYLLGRWNYAIARVGIFSRAYVKVVYGSLPHATIADAITDFKKACALAPDRILNHAGLAMAYDADGDKKLKIAELQKCCTLKPAGPEDADALKDAKEKLAALGQ